LEITHRIRKHWNSNDRGGDQEIKMGIKTDGGNSRQRSTAEEIPFPTAILKEFKDWGSKAIS